MDSSWKRPAAKMVKPRGNEVLTSEQATDAREAQEIAEAEHKHLEHIRDNEDKIGGLIGGAWWIQNWTNPVLAHPQMPQLSVSRFYPDAFVAVDIFVTIGDWEKKLIEYKREQFKKTTVEHGGKTGKVRYGALSYADPLASLVPQLES